MDDIFINYRREDSSPYAGRLYDFLRQTFPDKKVFIDVDTIDPGEDFVEAIDTTLTKSRVVIAVIGPNWGEVTDNVGMRRLDNPDDYVVRELVTALESSIHIIPVLVGGAEMPRQELLPQRLQLLARRNPINISDTNYLSDVNKLVTAISRYISPTGKSSISQFQQKPNDSFRASPDLTDRLTTLKTLVWTDYTLGTLEAINYISKQNEAEVYLVLINLTLILGILAWFNIMLLRGKNWARMAYIVIFSLSLSATLTGLSTISVAENVLNIVSLVLSLWILRIAFTMPVKQIFSIK
jgi:hypothetical protein